MFTKNIDTSDRNAMTAFLKTHQRYYTLNSWNGMTSYANNVKIYNLDIPEELKDKAYDFVCIENPEYECDVNAVIREFEAKTGYTIGTNGRSGGYLVMYDNKSVKSIDADVRDDDFFDNWDDDEIKARVELVSLFDEYCDMIISTLADHLSRCTIGTREVITVVPAVLYNE